MNARELITDAWFLSGIVSRDLQVVEGSQASDGLEILNDLLNEKSITTKAIPYNTHLEFPLVVGQEIYDIPDLVAISAITFNLEEVRYSISRSTTRMYFGSPRVDNINSLPYEYEFERVVGGCKLYLFFKPLDTYLLKITGKVALSQVTLDTVLNPGLDRFYQSYLKYLLAKRLCDWYSFPFPEQKMATLKDFEDSLNPVVPLDLTAQKQSTLTKQSGWSWAYVNLGRGWIPS